VVVYIVGLNFAKLVGVLQLSHIMNTYFNQFRKSIMFIISVMNLLLVINSNIRLDDQTKHKWISLCYYVLLVLSILAYLHFIVNVALQMSEILDIRIFFNKNQCKYYLIVKKKGWKRSLKPTKTPKISRSLSTKHSY